MTGTASVKDAWKEISDVLNENKAASTQTPFTVTFIVLISIHFLKKKVENLTFKIKYFPFDYHFIDSYDLFNSCSMKYQRD